MTRINKSNFYSVKNLAIFVIPLGLKEFKRLFRVLGGIKRINTLSAGTLVLSVLPFRIRLLDMRGIHEHYAAKLICRLGRIYRSAEAVRNQKRYPARVVYMSVREKQRVDL